MKATKYFVYLDGDDRYDWFDEEVEAIVYAQKNGNKNTKIYKVEGELSDDGFDFDYDETKMEPVEFSMELPKKEPVEVVDDNDFEQDFPDIPDVENSDDSEYDAMAKQYADDQLVDPYDSDEYDGHEDFDVKEALDKLEENESEVECKNCFDLFPKEECVKTEHGYLCKKCNQELHSHQGTNLDLIDANPKDLDYDDPRFPEEKEEPEVKEEPVNADEMRKHEKGINEELKRKLNTEADVFDYYYNNWLDCDVDRDELYAMFEKGLSGKKFPAASLAKAYGWGSDYDYLDSVYKIGKDIHDRGLQAVVDEMAQDYALDNANDPNDQKELKTLKEDTDQKLKLYVIFNDGVEVGELVASNETDAVDRCYNGAFGSSTSDDMFSAELVEDPERIAEYEKTWKVKLYNLEELADYEDEDTFDALDRLNTDTKKIYSYTCSPSGLSGAIDATSEKEARRKVEEILAAAGVYVPDERIKFNENLEEHVNDRPADIESDQKLQGVDNAVVDCKKYTLVAHSEDEKPVDCKLEKPALEEPLAGDKVDVELYEDNNEDEEEIEYAPFYYLYDYGGWYLYSAYKNTDETNCVTMHRSNDFYEKKKYTGKIFNSLEEVIQDVLDNNELYLHLTDPDFMSYGGRRAGAIAAVELNSKRNGWERYDMIFDRKGKKLVQVPVTESLQEAKKDEEELPPDPEVVKLEVHQELNNLVADEIEAINGYEEVKADIIDKPIEHKDEIIDTINHIEDEEKEHIDELVNVTTEIPFEDGHKEEAPAPVVEEPAPVVEEPVVEEDLAESAADTPFDSEVKVGDSILIINMEGEPDYCGRKGKVEHIDGIGQLHGTWGGCAVIPGVDKFDIITNECLKEDVNKVGYITMVIGDGGDDIYYVGYDKDAAIKAVDDQYPDWINFGLGGGDTAPGVIECNLSDDKNQAAFDTLLKRYNNKEKLYDGDLKAFGYSSYRELLNNFYDNLKVIYSGDEEAPEDEWPTWDDEDPFAITDSDIEYLNTEAPGLDDENDGRALHELNLKDALTAAQHWYEVNDGDVFWFKVAKALEAKLKQANENDLIDSFALSNDEIIVNTKQANESLKEDIDDEVKCGWCGEKFPESECRHEKDFGYLCPQCEAELKSRGEQLVFIENENLEEASSAETRAFKNGGKDLDDLVQGKAIARIKDPKARAAAVAAAKAGRPDAVKAFTGDRKEDQAAAAYEKKAQAMDKAMNKDADNVNDIFPAYEKENGTTDSVNIEDKEQKKSLYQKINDLAKDKK